MDLIRHLKSFGGTPVAFSFQDNFLVKLQIKNFVHGAHTPFFAYFLGSCYCYLFVVSFGKPPTLYYEVTPVLTHSLRLQ